MYILIVLERRRIFIATSKAYKKNLAKIVLFFALFLTPLQAETGGVVELSKDTFEAIVIRAKKPVLVMFHTFWCQPCKDMKPIFIELAQEERSYIFATFAMHRAQSFAREYGIQRIPAFLLFKSGAVSGKLEGTFTKEELLREIKSRTSSSLPLP